MAKVRPHDEASRRAGSQDHKGGPAMKTFTEDQRIAILRRIGIQN